MRKKTKTWNKIKEPFKELGIELKKNNNMYEFEYNQTQMFLYVVEEEEMFLFTAFVAGVEKREDKEKLDIALDIVNVPHCVYSASWTGRDAIFASSFYRLKNKKQVSEKWLSVELKKYWDAYMYFEANIFLLSGIGL